MKKPVLCEHMVECSLDDDLLFAQGLILPTEMTGVTISKELLLVYWRIVKENEKHQFVKRLITWLKDVDRRGRFHCVKKSSRLSRGHETLDTAVESDSKLIIAHDASYYRGLDVKGLRIVDQVAFAQILRESQELNVVVKGVNQKVAINGSIDSNNN